MFSGKGTAVPLMLEMTARASESLYFDQYLTEVSVSTFTHSKLGGEYHTLSTLSISFWYNDPLLFSPAHLPSTLFVQHGGTAVAQHLDENESKCPSCLKSPYRV
tara:strand:+ start:1023 stop:1334 length:312 start_codon:yes stop_codon:yes gene_type:complete